MTANAADLTTLADLKVFIKDGGNNDTLLQTLITAASVAIANYISRDIVSQSYTDVLDGTNGRVMVLPNSPITAIASVTIDGKTIPAGSVTTPGFYFTPTKIILNGYYFSKGYGNVVITYTAGFASIPQDIAQFCIGTVQYWLNDRQRAGEVSRSMGGQTISYSRDDMPAWVKTGLNQYKKVATA